jgi:hypothetical protein
VIGVQDQSDIEESGLFGAGFLIVNHVQEVCGVTQVGAWCDRLEVLLQADHDRDDRGHLRDQIQGLIEFAFRADIIGLRVEHAKHADGTAQHVHRVRISRE